MKSVFVFIVKMVSVVGVMVGAMFLTVQAFPEEAQSGVKDVIGLGLLGVSFVIIMMTLHKAGVFKQKF